MTLVKMLTGFVLVCGLLDARAVITRSLTSEPVLSQISVEVIARGLDTPWAIDFAPDGRIFLTERPGRIRVIENGQLQAEPWMIVDSVEVGEGGLLGLALDPQFAMNRYVYVAYTYRSPDGRLQNRLARLREDPMTRRGVFDRVLLESVPGNSNHDGGRVKIGPDGKIYWTMGDANNRPAAQDISSLSGKILRLNPDGTVPADNPFPGSYVYSYGHRNPQGLAWQPGTGLLYETEHGPSGAAPDCCRDEVNLIEPGKNYGWPTITGDQTMLGMVSPLIHSGNTTTWAPSGATFVTQGPWAGSMLFTALRGQSLNRLTLEPNDPRRVVSFEQLLVQQYGRLRDVVEGPDGLLYVLTSNRDGRGSPVPDDDRVLRLTVSLIGPVGEIVRAYMGFQFTEGPATDIDGNVYFSDVQRNRIYKVNLQGELSVFLENTQGCNGLMFDQLGRLIAAQSGAGRIIAIDVKSEEKEIKVIADQYQGRRFNSPNDLVIDAHGGIYFSDPSFGGQQFQDRQGVYYINAEGQVTRVIDTLTRPNGVILSPDEKTLYVLHGQPSLMTYPIMEPGQLGEGKILAMLQGTGGGDGMTIDTKGNLYVTRPNSRAIQVVNPKGEGLGLISFAEAPSNVTFGGPELKTLFVTARTSVYTAPMEAVGHRFAKPKEP